jgi:hypothetical protein
MKVIITNIRFSIKGVPFFNLFITTQKQIENLKIKSISSIEIEQENIGEKEISKETAKLIFKKIDKILYSGRDVEKKYVKLKRDLMQEG